MILRTVMQALYMHHPCTCTKPDIMAPTSSIPPYPARTAVLLYVKAGMM
jgi:hypothetical protein